MTDTAIALESKYADELARVRPEFREGARNLIHYLALRKADTEQMRIALRRLGLYSMAHAERNVLGLLEAVLRAIDALTKGTPVDPAILEEAIHTPNPSAKFRRQDILGPAPADRDVRIMVTLPTEAAHDRGLVDEMLAAGMNLARINCAHDDADTWKLMIDNVRAAAADAGTECRVIMDLAGPKLRTGELLPGPRVMHIRRKRDPMGRVIAPRRVRLIPDDVLHRGTKAAVIPVPRECIELARKGDEIRFRDTRGRKRCMRVVKRDDKGLTLESWQSAYMTTGAKLTLVRKELGERLKFRVGELPSVERPLLLRSGDTLIIHADSRPGEPAREDDDGNILEPAHIACQQPVVFAFLSTGEPISLNDG